MQIGGKFHNMIMMLLFYPWPNCQAICILFVFDGISFSFHWVKIVQLIMAPVIVLSYSPLKLIVYNTEMNKETPANLELIEHKQDVPQEIQCFLTQKGMLKFLTYTWWFLAWLVKEMRLRQSHWVCRFCKSVLLASTSLPISTKFVWRVEEKFGSCR